MNRQSVIGAGGFVTCRLNGTLRWRVVRSAVRAGVLSTFVIAVVMVSQGLASVMTYTDFDSWAAAAGTYETETFNDATLNPGLGVVSTAGQISGGVWSDRIVRGGATTTFTLPSSATAFGGNWDLTPAGAGNGIGFDIYLSAGGTETLAAQIPNNYSGQFFGFTSTDSFDSVFLKAGTISGKAETFHLDNMVYNHGVPSEPALLTVPENSQSLNFGNIRVGTASNPMGIIIRNVGNLGSVLAGSFSAPNGFGQFSPLDPAVIGPLGADDGPQVKEFVFEPSQRGVALPKTIQVATNGGASTIMLRGRGVGPLFQSDLDLVSKQAIVDFGDASVGSNSARSFIVQNRTSDGDLDVLTDLTIIDARIEGEHANDFQILNGLSTSHVLAANAYSSVSVQYTPSGSGQRSAVLVVSTDEDSALGEESARGEYRFHLLGNPTKELKVQPIFVTDSLGNGGLNADLLSELGTHRLFVEEIWKQADIDVEFVEPTYLASDDLISMDEEELVSLQTSVFNDSESEVLHLWFVDEISQIDTVTGMADYVLGLTGPLGGAIDYEVLKDNYYGVIAHEIGHALGLFHPEDEEPPFSLGPRNLMTRGDVSDLDLIRSIADFADLAPNGQMTAALTVEQIAMARSRGISFGLLGNAFSIAVPEPSTWAMLVTVPILALWRRSDLPRRRKLLTEDVLR